MSRRALTRKITTSFKMSGLSLRTDAVKALQSVLRQEENVDAALEAILSAISKKLQNNNRNQGMIGSVVDLQTIEQVVTDLTKNSEDRQSEALTVVDAYDSPRLCYDPVKKSFYFYSTRVTQKMMQQGSSNAPSPGSSSSSSSSHTKGNDANSTTPGRLNTTIKPFHGDANTKVQMFRERFQMVKQRVLRNPLFCRPTIGGVGGQRQRGGAQAAGHIELTPIDSLLGARGTLVLLGMLTRREEGKYHLEDMNGNVEIDLSEVRVTDGLFTLGCIVVVEGYIGEDSALFHVDTMGFPPPETRVDSLSYMSAIDLSLMTGYTQQEEVELVRLEEEAEETMFVMLSDVHLDSPEVMHKLRLMFEGFSMVDTPPAMFVLMGNFTSEPFGKDSSDVMEYQQLFSNLGDLLLEFPKLCNGSKFLFVPGPNDPGAKCLPRAAIPSFFTQGFTSKFENASNMISFTTNPCRIKYFTQEIVVFRDNVLNRMRRQCVVPPIVKSVNTDGGEMGTDEEEDMDVTSAVTEHLVKTVLDQGHLCPLPLTQVPIRWTHDACLRLYPLPDLLMMADHYDQYHSSYQECAAVNPGSFPTDFSFLVYRPYSRGVEFSRIG